MDDSVSPNLASDDSELNPTDTQASKRRLVVVNIYSVFLFFG